MTNRRSPSAAISPDKDRTSEQALAALNRAALAIARNLKLPEVLSQIVEAARELVGARYAALGMPNRDGLLEEFIFEGMVDEEVAKVGRLPQGLGLLGAIIEEAHSIRVPVITDDPRAIGFPPNHPQMTSFLGVPVVAGDEVLGNLYLTDKLGPDGQPIPFTKSDEQLMEMFAAHAAIAVQNARLHEHVSRLAIVEERARIGMDLHDGVIQDIYAVGLTLESARMMLSEEQKPLKELLDRTILALNGTIHDIRNFILDLRPRRFEGDLSLGLGRLAREFQANTMIPVTLEAQPEFLTALPHSLALSLFLTTQEALANVARHARASAVTIIVRPDEDAVVLTIDDDGRGFDLDRQTRMTGHGLANMRARAEEHGGIFNIRSAPGAGTTVRVKLPIAGR